MLNWYQGKLGSRVELLRPGDDEYSVYVHIDDFEGGKDVLAVFVVPESISGFVKAIRDRIRCLNEGEIPVDYIDVWVPGDWINKLEDIVERLNEENKGFPYIRIRDSAELKIPSSAIEELISKSKSTEVPSISSKDIKSRYANVRRPVLRQRTSPATEEVRRRKLKGTYPVTEEKLEEILERVIRRVEEERRINYVEKTVDELQRRLSLLEEIIRFLISSRTSLPQQLSEIPAPSEQRAYERKVVEESPRPKPQIKGELHAKQQPREYSVDLIEEFVKDNPWADVLKEKRGDKEEGG
ncbi:MAG: hypothetical protein DRO05_05805 [Thermoproteota archaeon]|nr:MAG: hypothetical protein DRO05_05805 [Candidatus Korarchaeota archaeon]